MGSNAVINFGPYSYTSRGFLFNGIPRASLQALHSTLDPVPPKNSRDWTPPKITANWFSGQLGHYGLKGKGSKANREAQLREAIANGLCKHQPEEQRVKEESMKTEWIELRRIMQEEEKRMHEEQYERAATDEERLDVDCGRLWFEKFKASGERTAVLKHIEHGRLYVYALVKPQNIIYYAWEMAGDPKNQKWLTIGYDECEVRERATEEIALYKTVLKARQEERDAEEMAHLKHVQSIAKSQPEKFTSKHVLGTWDVSCQEIESGYGMMDLSMTLFMDREAGQIVGELHFGVMEGILRLKGKPSATRPCIEIYWACREAGGRMIICESGNNRKGKIEFSGRGAKAKLYFNELAYVGPDVTCTAVKASHEPVEGSVDFSQYSRAAYEYARVKRWG
ncbi:hypothetical protein Q9L58_002322 [Maublancomyces gigas]|uniref:Uncharacterized protein n=1 Tax=Discina gigas TaxID=1032678 RepID=A0ABR3GRN8_9PEZI